MSEKIKDVMNEVNEDLLEEKLEVIKPTQDSIILSNGDSLFIATEDLSYEIENPLIRSLRIDQYAKREPIYSAGFHQEPRGFVSRNIMDDITIDISARNINSYEGYGAESIKNDILSINIEEEVEKIEDKTVYELLKVINKKINER
jgi:hypothetical protein